MSCTVTKTKVISTNRFIGDSYLPQNLVKLGGQVAEARKQEVQVSHPTKALCIFFQQANPSLNRISSNAKIEVNIGGALLMPF